MSRQAGPLLIVVNGRPATGKTELARRLGRDLAVPVFCKDDFKELFGQLAGSGGRESSHRVGAAAFLAMYQAAERVLSAGLPAIIEAPFDPAIALEDLGRLQRQTDCRVLQILLRADAAVILERYRSRARDPVHQDSAAFEELAATLATELEPVPISGRAITVDTTDFSTFDYPALAALVEAELRDRSGA